MQACAAGPATAGRPLAAARSLARPFSSSAGRASAPLGATRRTQKIGAGRTPLRVSAVAEAERTGGAAAAGAHTLSVEVKQEGAQTRILVEGTARPGERQLGAGRRRRPWRLQPAAVVGRP